MRRVVITGIGLVTPLGVGALQTWNRLVAGESGLDYVSLDTFDGIPKAIGAQVSQTLPLIDRRFRKQLRLMSAPVRFLMASAEEAFTDSKLSEFDFDSRRMGVFIGGSQCGFLFESLLPAMAVATDQKGEIDDIEFGRKGLRLIDPNLLLISLTNAGSGFVSIFYNAQGPNNNFVDSDTASAQAIGAAYQAIQQGQADVVFAGGYDSLVHPMTYLRYKAEGLLTQHFDSPLQACRPFSCDRDGFGLGEGAATLIMEDFEIAKCRGAHIYAELCGYGNAVNIGVTCEPEAARQAMVHAIRESLRDAHCLPPEVDYICAHGDGTVDNDLMETEAITNCFGDASKHLTVSSIKPMTGYLGAASGAVEFASTVLAMEKSIIPPTINLFHPDPQCNLDYIPNSARQQEIRTAISVNYSQSGQTTALLVRKGFST